MSRINKYPLLLAGSLSNTEKQKFDIALAETVENFVLIYNKNLKKYNCTSTDFISQFVRENMLDKAVQSLIDVLKKVIEDTQDASLAAYFLNNKGKCVNTE